MWPGSTSTRASPTGGRPSDWTSRRGVVLRSSKLSTGGRGSLVEWTVEDNPPPPRPGTGLTQEEEGAPVFRPGGSTSVSPRPSHRTDRPPHPLRPARAWVGSGQVRAVTDLCDCQTVRAAAPTCWPAPGSTKQGPSPAGRSAPGGAVRRPPASTGSGPHTGQAAGAAVLSWTASAPRYTTPRLWRADGTASTRVLTGGSHDSY